MATRNFAVVPSAMVFEMPLESALPDTSAAAVYLPFHLSWLALRERAKVQAGETVLIHAAAGGVGSAAVQLAALSGSRVIATAGSAEKVDLCRSLGADLAINYLEDDFVEAVLEATSGRGVDVAFDSVGGEMTTKTFRCMAFNGRHLLVGFASGIEAEDVGIVPRPVLFGNFSLYGVCLAYVDNTAAVKDFSGYNFPSHADGERIHERVLDLLSDGRVRPVVGRERSLRASTERSSSHGEPRDSRAQRRRRGVFARLKARSGVLVVFDSAHRHRRDAASTAGTFSRTSVCQSAPVRTGVRGADAPLRPVSSERVRWTYVLRVPTVLSVIGRRRVSRSVQWRCSAERRDRARTR